MFPHTNHNHLRSESGFSLSELLVVMFIIGIVAAISIPSFILQRKNEVDSRVKSDIAAANNVIESWIIRHPSQKVPSGTIDYDETTKKIIVSTSLTGNGLQGFKVSTGNHLKVEGLTSPRGTYKITGTNDRGNTSATGLVFDSSKGGF